MLTFTNLNTVDNPHWGFRDETQRIQCRKCGNCLIWQGRLAYLSDKHLELCEGDSAVTLMKVEQWFKEKYRHG